MNELRGTGLGLHLIAVHAVEESARRVRAIGVLVRQRRARVFGVPAFAGDHAGMAEDKGIKVDHKAEFAVGLLRERGHGWRS